jgi:hypothetical protein
VTDKNVVPEVYRPQAASQGCRFSVSPMSESESLRNGGCTVPNCASLGEILETVNVIDEGDAQSWYTAWKATSDLVFALAERTQESVSKGGA